jgi:hypothetical protein
VTRDFFILALMLWSALAYQNHLRDFGLPKVVVVR